MLNYKNAILFLFLIFNYNLSFGQFYYGFGPDVNFYNEDGEETVASFRNIQPIVNYAIDQESNQIITQTDYDQLLVLSFDGISSGPFPNYGSEDYFYSDTDIDLIYQSSENRFYYAHNNKIEFVDLDTEDGYITLVNANVGGIALDESINKLFWTDKTNNKVMKSDVTGDNLEEVYYLPSGLADLDDIEVDPINQIIYWANKGQGRIQSCKYDGSQFENILTALSSPISLVLDESNLYWIDEINEKIMYYDLMNQTTETYESDFSGGINLQKNTSTNQLFWISRTTFSNDIVKMNLATKEIQGVISPIEDYGLGDVILDPVNEKIFISTYDKIIFCNLDGSNSKTIATSDDISISNQSIAYDPLEELIFVPDPFEVFYKTLSSDEWNSFENESNNNFDFDNFQIDITNKKLYWSHQNIVYRSDYDGQNHQAFYTSNNSANITSYYIDGINEKIYYSSDGFIRRANLDETGQEAIINGGTSQLIADPINDRLYYLKDGNIYYSNLEGYFETLFIDEVSNINVFKSIDINSFNLLPLINGNAFAQGNEINLDWTLDENFTGFVNNSVSVGDFFIERKTLTEDWKDIGSKAYFEGVSSYSFTDTDPEFGLNSYRLRYISDNGGLTSYSKNFEVDYLVGVETKLPSDINLWYRHMTHEIKTEGFTGQVNIYNELGQLSMSEKIIHFDSAIDVSYIDNGIHFAEIITEDGSKYAVSFFKPR